jgi:uncharacterized protein (DUF433 family)
MRGKQVQVFSPLIYDRITVHESLSKHRRHLVTQLDRISLDAEIMGGKPCIKGTRVTVGMIVSQIANGATYENLLQEYPYIKETDIVQALRFAAWASESSEVPICA